MRLETRQNRIILGNDYASLLNKEDEDTILELLDITSEELVRAFKWKIPGRKDSLKKYFSEEISDTEEEYGVGVHIEDAGTPDWQDDLSLGED